MGVDVKIPDRAAKYLRLTAGRLRRAAPRIDLLFNPRWYYERYPDAAQSRMNPFDHYLRYGEAEGRQPNPLFFPSWYCDTYPDVVDAGMSPLKHYLDHGEMEGRQPNPLFFPSWYCKNYSDVLQSGLSPLAHYLSRGESEGRQPNPLFFPSWYGERYPDVAQAAVSRLAHYLTHGEAEGRQPNCLFDPDWYRRHYFHGAFEGMSLLAHYLTIGEAEGRQPNAIFDPHWYGLRNPDVVAAGMSPLQHFIMVGREEGRSATALDEAELIAETIRDGRIEAASRLFDIHQQMLPPDGVRRELRAFEIQGVLERANENAITILKSDPREDVASCRSTHAAVAAVGPADKISSALPLYVARLSNVAILGGTRYLFPAGGRTVLSDEECYTYGDVTISQKYLRSWRAPEERLVLQFERKATTRLAQGIHLMCEGDFNYFHSICELLPRLMMAETVDEASNAPILVTAGLHANIGEALRLVNRGARRIIELDRDVMYQVDDLIFPSDTARVLNIYDRRARNDEGWLSPRWMGAVRGRVLAEIGIESVRADRKIYVRRGSNVRTITNEAELEEMLFDQGFEIVSIDKLSFRAQVKLFASANQVVLPTGASCTNLLWCRPGTRVTILSSDHPLLQLQFWQELAGSVPVELTFLSGPRAFQIVGKQSVHDNYRISARALSDKLAVDARKSRSYKEMSDGC